MTVQSALGFMGLGICAPGFAGVTTGNIITC